MKSLITSFPHFGPVSTIAALTLGLLVSTASSKMDDAFAKGMAYVDLRSAALVKG